MTSAFLLKEPLLVEAGGAGLERGCRYAVVGVINRLNALLAQNVVQAAVLKTQRWRKIKVKAFPFLKVVLNP